MPDVSAAMLVVPTDLRSAGTYINGVASGGPGALTMNLNWNNYIECGWSNVQTWKR